MELIILGSSSAGNSYVLRASDGEMLLIECGVRFDKIKQSVGFRLNKISAALVTHEHGDHCKSIQQVLAAGINVWASRGTHEACGTYKHHRARITGNGQQFKAGSFTVMAFDVRHDVREPLGFIINHPESGNVLFLTDTYYVDYRFRNLNNIIIEANYDMEIVDSHMERGSMERWRRNRLIESHMNLDTCKKTLLANDLSKVVNILLIHLSDSNSHAQRFRQEIQETTGKIVHIADKNQIIPFNKTAI